VLVDLARPSFLEVEAAAVRAFAAMLEKAEAGAGSGSDGGGDESVGGEGAGAGS
jgi:hypothetical protein